jgi:hypothetical protein
MLYCIYNLLNMFRHLYAHHQEFETILVLLPHMVCNALVAGGRLLGVEQQAMRPGCTEKHASNADGTVYVQTEDGF